MDPPSRKTKPEGIDATNRDYAPYDQVRKVQAYRLAEAPEAELFDEEYRIQTCDMGRVLHGAEEDKQAFARELGEALRDIGFAILEGHGIDPRLHDECERAVERLFTEHTQEEKLRFSAQRHGSVNQGFFPLQQTTEIHPDQVEGWVFCRRAFDLGDDPEHSTRVGDYWPDPEAERCFRRLCLQQEKLILPIAQSILSYLGCDPHSFDERLTKTNFGLRLNYYPPLQEPSGPAAGAARLLGHEDVDLFTLLPAPRSEGLQVLNRRNFRWIRLAAPPGTIILNTGDYMQRITNDILPSTTHRVSQPQNAELRRQSRVSFPMNVYLWEDELLEVLPGLGEPKYEPIEALEFHTKTTAKYYGDDYAVDGSEG